LAKGIFYVLTRILLFSIAIALIAPQAEAGRGGRRQNHSTHNYPDFNGGRRVGQNSANRNIVKPTTPTVAQSYKKELEELSKLKDIEKEQPFHKERQGLQVEPKAFLARKDVSSVIRASIEKNGELQKYDVNGKLERVLPSSIEHALHNQNHINAADRVINKAHSNLISSKSEVSLDNIIASINELKRNLNNSPPPAGMEDSYKDDLSNVASINVFPYIFYRNNSVVTGDYLQVGLKESPKFVMVTNLNVLLRDIEKFRIFNAPKLTDTWQEFQE
jgi:hypothetical protein